MGAKIPQIDVLLAAGVDPKSKQPFRIAESGQKATIKKIINEIDRLQYVNRYKWFNLPCNLSSQELERMLYFKGSLVAFYFKEIDEFFFMPYALDGTLDFYGRYNVVHPIPMTYGTEEQVKAEKESQSYKDKAALLSTLKLKIQRGVVLDDLDIDEASKLGVILYDRTLQLGQNVIPRWVAINDFIDMEADLIPYMNTALMMETGVRGLRVPDEDSRDEAFNASKQVKLAALGQSIYIPITSPTEFQDLGLNVGGGKAQDYLLATQALENLRLSTLGIDNGGIFEKKAHELQAEADLNSTSVEGVLDDGLAQRQNFCNIFNSIWGTEIWVDLAQSVIAQDLDQDGLLYDNDIDGSNSGIERSEQQNENA